MQETLTRHPFSYRMENLPNESVTVPLTNAESTLLSIITLANSTGSPTSLSTLPCRFCPNMLIGISKNNNMNLFLILALIVYLK